MRFHVCVPITKALDMLKDGNNLFEPATPLEAFGALMTSQAAGKKYYTGCDNENVEGRCAGHEEVK